jgi:hypothetical protein
MPREVTILHHNAHPDLRNTELRAAKLMNISEDERCM